MNQKIMLLILFLFTFSAAEEKKLTDPVVDKVLDALDKCGKDLTDFAADVSLAESDPSTGTDRLKIGKVWYQKLANDETRIHVIFDQKKSTGKFEKYQQEYLLEAGKLIEMNFEKKVQTRRQVLKPGEKLNPLKLGEGPFPLPIGQARDEVYKNFAVKLIAAQKDDPAKTTHLLLKPVTGTRFAKNIVQLDVFVNETGFPARIVTLDKDGSTERTTDLSNVKINGGVKDENFTVAKLTKDWTVKETGLSD